MIYILSKIFIKDSKNFKDERVRTAYGILCSLVGIGINIVLFIGKIFAGLISGAISITADAFNNLSDAGSSIITLLGFRLSKQKPDPEHPFGHGRFEYLSGLMVSVIILIMAFELVKTSIDKIIHPDSVEVSLLAIIILGISIIFKVYMGIYNSIYGKKIASTAMKATAVDSVSDTIATTVVLICSLLQMIFGLKIDAYAGIAVGLFIAYAGISALKETVSPLLGQNPDPEFVEEIEKIVLSHEEVVGIHDLIVHDYGPGRLMVTLHAEVPADANILEMHDVIDNIEYDLRGMLGCEATIHMDPIDYKDEETAELRGMCTEIIKKIDERMTLHDFRIVKGNTHTNLIFDVVVPRKLDKSDEEIKRIIGEEVLKIKKSHYCVINVDQDFTGKLN